MTLKEKITGDVKDALRKGDAARLSVLRLLQSAISNKEIEKMKKETGLTDLEIQEVVSSEAKKRKDSIELFRKGGREEAAKKEEAEAAVLMEYLPAQLSEGEIAAIVKAAIAKTGAQGEGDFGKAMKEITPQVKGRADGAFVARLAKEALAKS